MSVFVGTAAAQINPMDAQLFHNQYLANPAKAGAETGAHLNLGYRNQWSSMPGSPRSQMISYEVQSKKIGLGLTVINDKAGLLNYTKVMGTYAYHLPLSNDKQFLHFGINLGVYKPNLNIDAVVADPNDPDLVNYNSRETLFDGDAGFAYSSERFSAEAVFYNLKGQLKGDFKNLVDNQLTFIAAEYAFPVADWSVQSKIAYRGVRNYTDILDIGFNATTADQKLDFTAIYHSSKSASFGIGYVHRKNWHVLGVYNTPNATLSNYANGTFEVALRVHLPKK